MLRAVGQGSFRVGGLQLPDLSGKPVIDPGREDAAASLLRRIVATTPANGHRGVAYDNRDRGHSTLPADDFPGLAQVRYAEDLRGGDFGLATRLRFPFVVLGNSSTALTSGPNARSLTRLAMTEPGIASRVFGLAADNHLYIYPEHRDHDDVDLYPANWPYTVTTQGSSGSDRPFLDAFAMTLAAFTRETMETMAREGLVVPTLQMILRRNLLGIDRLESYFGPAAHPAVFDRSRLRPERMIAHAASLTPETIPPRVRLAIVWEDFKASAGLAGRSERLFDTPSAIARVWRGPEGRKRMTVSAAGTRPITGEGLEFRWVRLQGDPRKVTILPDETGATAEIILDWHDAFEVPSANGVITTSRVDIGVFATGNGEPSAPAIISVSFPTHQVRKYEAGPTGMPRLRSIDYDAIGRGTDYDPLLHWSAPWVDAPVRDPEGMIVGWRRRDGERTKEVGATAKGAPGYEIISDRTGRPVLQEVWQ